MLFSWIFETPMIIKGEVINWERGKKLYDKGVENLEVDISELHGDVVLGTFEIVIDTTKDIHVFFLLYISYLWKVNEQWIELKDPIIPTKIVGKLNVSFKAEFLSNSTEDDIEKPLHIGTHYTFLPHLIREYLGTPTRLSHAIQR